jgi:hypothetical protein
MESILMLGRLLSFISLLVFPQLLGVLVYFRLTRLPNWIAVTLAALTPPLVFFFLSPVFFFAGMREAQAKGELTCGMPAMAALMMVFTGSIAEFLGGLIVQSVLNAYRRRSL